MAGKYYVVRNGRKNGIYRTWNECKVQVDGFPCAVYKSFKTEEEAIQFYGKGNGTPEEAGWDTDNVVKAYVDGSFYQGEFSYGMVILRDGREICFSKKPVIKDLHRCIMLQGR